MIDVSKSGRLISRDEILEIYQNHIVSRHAQERLTARGGKISDMVGSNLAYVNTDGSINIQSRINKKHYFVFMRNDSGKWVCVSYKEESMNGVSLYKKLQLAKKGYERRVN